MFARVARLFHRPAAPNWLDVGELRQRLAASPTPWVVDVRGPDEFDGPLGHIAGARNIALGELPAHQAEIAAANRPIILVCLTDRRSSAAAAQLAEAGMRDVSVLRGGMKAWREVE